MSLKHLPCLILLVCAVAGIPFEAAAQERERVVEDSRSHPPDSTQTRQIPTLENQIVIQNPTVRKITSSRPLNAPPPLPAVSAGKIGFSAVLRSRMMSSISSKLGIPYRYGSNGPHSYDCSSFVWAVFGDIGINFNRTSARVYWKTFEPVRGKDRFRFGTLVFFNRLGHVGIVVDRNGFYHASSSRGVTYSKFKGYWEKRIVGYRRVPLEEYLY